MEQTGNDDLHDEHAELVRLIAEQPRDPSPGKAIPGDTAEPIEALVRELGHYRLIRRLGQGGQGVVYLAEDTRLGREIALKILSTRSAASPDARERFRREALAASKLRHPGICTVHEAGEVDGQRFLAMEFVDGGDLPDWIESSRSSTPSSDTGSRRSRIDRALQIAEGVARAVQAAHDAGIVHRDLKPQNVMLRRDGSPVVLDFGLARDDGLDSETLTLAGDLLGTPAYLPPERVRGEHRPADAQSDVYGLGAMLYECLTGARPFDAPTREQLYHQILTARVEDPRRHDPAVPREARHVVDTALDKVPERRYASAAEFADDVRRLRERQAIHAQPLPLWLRAGRWVQRDPRVAVPTLAAFIALLAGLIAAWSLVGARDRALELVRAQALAERVDALVAAARNQLESDPEAALLQAQEAYALSQEPETRSLLYEALARPYQEIDNGIRTVFQVKWADFACDEQRIVVLNSRGLQVFRRDGSPVADRYQAPEGKPIAADFNAARERVAVAWTDGTVRVFAIRDQSLLAELKHPTGFGIGWRSPGAKQFVEFLPPGADLLLTGSRRGGSLWRLDDQAAELVWSEQTEGAEACQIAVATDGRHFAVADAKGAVRIYGLGSSAVRNEVRDAPRPQLISTVQAAGAVRAMAFDPKRKTLAIGDSDDSWVHIWSLDGQPRGSLETYGTAVNRLEFSANGDALLACDDDRSAHLWPTTDAPPGFGGGRRFTTHDGDVVAATFSPDGRAVLTASLDTSARIFDLEGREITRLRAGDGQAQVARFSADGSRVLTADSDGVVGVWRLEQPGFGVLRHGSTVLRTAVSDRFVVGTLRDGSIVLHDRRNEYRHQLEPDLGDVLWHLALSNDRSRMVVGARTGNLGAWDLSADVPARLGLNTDLRNIRGLAADPHGGSRIVVAFPGGAQILDLDDAGAPTELSRLKRTGPLVWAADGNVTGPADGAFRWDLAQETQFGLELGPTIIKELAISDDDRWLAVACSPPVIVLVNRVERRVAHKLYGHAGMLLGLEFSPDGRTLVSTSRDRSAKIWDVETGELIATLRGHRGSVSDCAFTPEGDRIVTSGTDGTIRFWPADFAEVERLAAKRAKDEE